MKKLNYMHTVFFLFISMICWSCGGSDNTDIDGGKTDPDPEPPVTYVYTNLFSDSEYKKGFNVSSTQEGNAEVHGILDYGDITTSAPVWRIAQWNCINNDIFAGTYSLNGSVHTYKTAKGNVVAADVEKGSLVLGINTSSEYGQNGITSNPRKSGESWPHLLIEYVLADKDILKVDGKEEIRMDIAYNVTQLDDKMPAGTTNADLHTAQFQWYVTVQNRTQGSEDYGRYIWFGLNFFDKRYEFPPAYAAQDGGKEHNTGAFIYVPEMSQIMGSQGKTAIGKDMHVDVDVLPIIKSAFKLAQERKYLLNTTWEDLYITTSNIGWEVPGTYDVTVRIDSVNIKYR
ncbi:hypothetical protein [uncultured Dysgonomonas sp.]|uniref:Uncharacterized protein n=1 Tax=uncultured Dysgonomonas sp. TaxID=206096 RepID=A0A212ITL4_9BACT|nr:hypothetical protein [uncultured Dysgonomonas sp.]SBV90546.1 conserved exported hypothetical protein [uncultured Dysgonomonas sp.]